MEPINRCYREHPATNMCMYARWLQYITRVQAWEKFVIFWENFWWRQNVNPPILWPVKMEEVLSFKKTISLISPSHLTPDYYPNLALNTSSKITLNYPYPAHLPTQPTHPPTDLPTNTASLLITSILVYIDLCVWWPDSTELLQLWSN